MSSYRNSSSSSRQAGVKVAILATGPFHMDDVTEQTRRVRGCSTRSLLELNGLPLLSYWLALIKQCPRLAPIEQNVFVLCNDSNKGELRHWASDPDKSAGGFPVDNICSNGASTSGSDTSDLQAWVESRGVAENLLILSGDAVFSPQFNFNRIVEHSLIRGTDTVTFVNCDDRLALPPGWPRLTLDSEGQGAQNPNPRVAQIDLRGESGSELTVAPLIFLRDTSLRHLRSFRPQSAQSETSDLGEFLQYLSTQEPIFALETIGLFTVSTPEQAEYADQFFRMYARELRLQKEGVRNIKHTESNVQLKLDATAGSSLTSHDAGLTSSSTGRSLSSTGRTAGLSSQSGSRIGVTAADLLRMGDNGPLPLHDIITTFRERYAGAQAERIERERNEPKLPPRFEDASMFKFKAKQEHPVFTTSSNAYGKKVPTQHEMPLKWSGVKGEFTSTQFAGGPSKGTTGFNTSVTKSKVHKLMDDF